jgi:hypothetical protein
VGNILLRKTGLEGLQDILLIQCGAEKAADVSAELRDGAGLVVSASAINHVRGGGLRDFRGPLLADRQRYVGASRVLASAGISPRWIADQRRAGTTVPLTDSGTSGQATRLGLTQC